MKMKTLATVSQEFKKLIKSGNYEAPILELMNASRKIFPGTYKPNIDQSCGECDFYDVDTLEKYEAKLSFSQEDGQLIANDNLGFQKWLSHMLDVMSEFSEIVIKQRDMNNVKELKLFKVIDDRLGKIEEDENPIFFLPFPITTDSEDSIYIQFATDIFSSIFQELSSQGKVGKRMIYVIYPAMREKMVLRCLNTYQREYLKSETIDRYITFKTELCT